MPTARDRAETPDPTDERPKLVQRILALPSRVFAAARSQPLLFLTLLCGTSIILGSGISVAYYGITHSPSSDRNVTIAAALALLDDGKFDEAKEMASRLSKKHKGDYRRSGHPMFVNGVVLAYEASHPGHEEERQTLHLVAARYLEESRDRGFPRGREQQGLYLLATSLFNAGHFAESLPVLHAALEKMPDQRYELARLLSAAYLLDSAPNLKQALHFNRIWLEDPALTDQQRDEAVLQLAEISLKLHLPELCQSSLDKIAADSHVHSDALIVKAQLRLQQGDQLIAELGESGDAVGEAKEKYSAAIGALEGSQRKTLPGATTGVARYLLGICHEKLGDDRAAKAAFERTRRIHYRTPEALAATLAEAEIAQQERHDDIALTLFLKVLEEAGTPVLYQNRWVSLGELQGRLSSGQQHFVLTEEFESALTMAQTFSPIMPTDTTAAALAETHESWAEHLLTSADSMGAANAEVTRADARRHFRQAGAAYRVLADLRFATPEYGSDLWKSGNCFLRGQNYNMAIQLLHSHLDNAPRKQAPVALVSLGECYLALGQYHSALNSLNECIKFFPKHPESYRARLLASSALRETGELADAQALLVDNLHNSSLTPRSRHWQESLLAYGRLLYEEAVSHAATSRRIRAGDEKLAREIDPKQAELEELQTAHTLFERAIDSLGSAVERQALLNGTEPVSRSSAEASYMIAEAYRRSAALPKLSLDTEPTQTRRNMLRQQMRAMLKDAAATHHALQLRLARKQAVVDLSEIESKILRNTYFGYANALFALEEYDSAITAYTAATNRYQHEPEALEAVLQIAACFRQLGSPAEAQGTMLQAEAVLERIPKDADFAKTTRYDREEWKKLITWLANR